MLVYEVLSRPMRSVLRRPDGRAGRERRESAGNKGSPEPGNARVRRSMIQLAWRFQLFQKQSGLARISQTG